MTKLCRALMAVGLLSLGCGSASAAIVTFTDVNLASGNPVTVDGITLSTSTVGGSISFIGSGQFAGLWLGGNNSSGTYTLGFSQAISSIVIEFDALSSVGTLPVETLFNFATNNGAVSIAFTSQFGTTFDGTTITSTENDGQGIIEFTGASFNAFSFDHNQGAQSGFVIESIQINTETTGVPEPGTLALLGLGFAGLAAFRRSTR